MKRCSKCGAQKPADALHRDARKTGGGTNVCKACRNRAQAVRHRSDPQRRRVSNGRWVSANPSYGREHRWNQRGIAFQGEPLTEAQFSRLLELQGGVCAICGLRPQRTLAADHDWTTGELRGLLDTRCNGYLVPIIEEALATDAPLLRQLAPTSLLGRAVAYVLDPPVRRLLTTH